MFVAKQKAVHSVNPTAETIGSKLKALRRAAHLTAEEAGDCVGKSSQTIYAYEAGRTQPDAAMFLTLLNLYQAKSISVFFPAEQTNGILDDYSALSAESRRKVVSYIEDLSAGEKFRSANSTDQSVHKQ